MESQFIHFLNKFFNSAPLIKKQPLKEGDGSRV